MNEFDIDDEFSEDLSHAAECKRLIPRQVKNKSILMEDVKIDWSGDIELRNKLMAAASINIFDYGVALANLLDRRKQIAIAMLKSCNQLTFDTYKNHFEWYNVQIKCILGL